MSQWAVVKETCGKKEFSKIHLSHTEADEEARRLCRLESKPFLVIKIIGRYYREEQPVSYEDLTGGEK